MSRVAGRARTTVVFGSQATLKCVEPLGASCRHPANVGLVNDRSEILICESSRLQAIDESLIVLIYEILDEVLCRRRGGMTAYEGNEQRPGGIWCVSNEGVQLVRAWFSVGWHGSLHSLSQRCGMSRGRCNSFSNPGRSSGFSPTRRRPPRRRDEAAITTPSRPQVNRHVRRRVNDRAVAERRGQPDVQPYRHTDIGPGPPGPPRADFDPYGGVRLQNGRDPCLPSGGRVDSHA